MNFLALNKTNQPIDPNYIYDPLFISIKDIQSHFSFKKVKAIRGIEAKKFNEAIFTFFANINISDSNHLNYIAQKLRLTDLSNKETYLKELWEHFSSDEDKISPSTIDFRLRAVLYIYRYYCTNLSADIKMCIHTGIEPLLKYLK